MIYLPKVAEELAEGNEVLRDALLDAARRTDIPSDDKIAFILARGLEAIHERQGHAMLLSLKAQV